MKLMEVLTYTNERGESIEFSTASVFHTNVSKDVLGLADVRNAIESINSMGQDGDSYIGSRITCRDIEIAGNIKELDKEQGLRYRRILNHILNPQIKAVLTYQRGSHKRVIDCELHSMAFPPGSIYPKFVIQLLGLNPYWRDEQERRHDVAGWEGLLEFPIRGPEDQPDGIELPIEEEWEIEARQPSLIVNVPNDGDARAGMRIEFRALGALSTPSLLNVNTGEFIKMNTPMLTGDVICVTTAYGEKDVTLRRNGVTEDAIEYIDVDSTFMQLDVGDNLFRYAAESGESNLDVTIWNNSNYRGAY